MRALSQIRFLLLLQLGTFGFYGHAAPGDVDLSFDPGSGVNGRVNAVELQPDGKILIGGEFTTVKGLARSGIGRLNADGSGDPTFKPGTGRTDLTVSGIALQSDGKVLIAGSAGGSGYVARLHVDGSIDSSFVASGIPSFISGFLSVVIQADGKILLGGNYEDLYFDSEGGIWYTGRHFLLRLDADGSKDTGYSGINPVLNQGSLLHSSIITAMTLQPDGEVVVSVSYSGGDFNGIILSRFDAEGKWDSSFNPGTGPDDHIISMVVQADGRLLLGGYFTEIDGTPRNGIARLHADGTLDHSFDPGAGAEFVTALALQADGKVLLGGFFDAADGRPRTGIARLHSDGSLDSGFDSGAGAIIGIEAGGILAIGVQADGEIIIGGMFTTVDGVNRSRMARLHADGCLDHEFDSGAGIDGTIHSLALQPDGKVIIGGLFATVDATERSGIARLETDGSLDGSFDVDTGQRNDVYATALQGDGKVFVAGQPTIRVHGDGRLDGGWNAVVGGSVEPSHITVQPDGKVLFAVNPGVYVNGGTRTLVRFFSDGRLDGNFNQAPELAAFVINSVALQADGKILIASGPNGIARLNADGSLDGSFRPGPEAYGGVLAIALKPDGKILIGGISVTSGGSAIRGIFQLHPDGARDSGFDPGSGVAGNPNGYPAVRAIAVQRDGKVLVGGYFDSVNGKDRRNMARLHSDGSVDAGFRADVDGEWSGTVNSIIVQPDGNILVAGGFSTVNGEARPHVVRLLGESAMPSLSIARSDKFVIVSWPDTGGEVRLCASVDLSPADAWLPVAEPAVASVGRVFVRVPITGSRQFFRLQSP